MSDIWSNPANVERLKLYRENGLSAARIAAEIGGITRNAVLGKIHRLGLSELYRASPSFAPRIRARRKKAAKPEAQPLNPAKRAPVKRIEREESAPIAMKTVELINLTASMCRWPLGDPKTPEFRFCGAAKAAHGSYCLHHRQLAYVVRPA